MYFNNKKILTPRRITIIVADLDCQSYNCFTNYAFHWSMFSPHVEWRRQLSYCSVDPALRRRLVVAPHHHHEFTTWVGLYYQLSQAFEGKLSLIISKNNGLTGKVLFPIETNLTTWILDDRYNFEIRFYESFDS